MKRREMIEVPSVLSWTAVIELLRENGDEGMTNKEIADALESDYQRVRSLTFVMWENGALSRVHVGETGGTTFYFLPLAGEVSNEQRTAAV